MCANCETPMEAGNATDSSQTKKFIKCKLSEFTRLNHISAV